MRVLVLGGSGMIGHRMWLACREHFDTFVVLRRTLANQPGADLFDPARVIEGVDLTDDGALGRALLRARPDVVVNAVGLIKQHRGAGEGEAAIALNAALPHRLAGFCRSAGCRLIHLSTDCVFSGQQGNYAETDLPDPPDLYGRSKLAGEVAGPAILTIRKSAVGRELAGHYGLLEWLLAQSEGPVRGFTRAVFSGLTTGELAETVVRLIADHPDLEGVRHVAAPAIAKYDLLLLVKEAFGLPTRIDPDDAVRLDRSLDDARFRSETGIPKPTWAAMVAALAADPLPYDAVRNGGR